jgi:hypothetical protein
MMNGTTHERQVHVNGMICWATCEWRYPKSEIGNYECVASPVNPGEFEPFVCETYEITRAGIELDAFKHEIYASK